MISSTLNGDYSVNGLTSLSKTTTPQVSPRAVFAEQIFPDHLSRTGQAALTRPEGWESRATQPARVLNIPDFPVYPPILRCHLEILFCGPKDPWRSSK